MKTKEQIAQQILSTWRRRWYQHGDVMGDRLSKAAGWARTGNILRDKGDPSTAEDHYINAVEIMEGAPLDFDWRKDPNVQT